ncbi:hypothetical protein [Paraburkholderia dinghuensis]|nr:hypothetical protein [Paraburkholderia dinghuensis]
MQLPIFRITFSIAFLWLSGISHAAQSADPLSTLPADSQQTTQPQWVKAVPPYSLEPLFSKAEVDLNSVKQGDNGQITAWERDTYEKIQQPSTDYAFQIGEAHYLIDCNDGKYTALAVNTRRTNGDLVKSVPMPEFAQKNLTDVPPDSLISAEVTLACAQAKKNWPGDRYYDLHIKPKHVATSTPLTSQEKEKIDQAIVQRKESDKRNTPFVAPLLTAQNGRNVCHTMNGADGNPSPYELCDAQGMFSHDVYSVRVGGIPFIQGIDDTTTKGIDGVFHDTPIRLQCEPVNQLADGVTNKTIEGAIQVDRMSSKKISFDDELKFAIATNVIEIGRHCTLSNTDGVMAKLDVVSP